MELKKYKLGEILDVTRGASLSGEFYATEGEYIRLTCGNFDYQNNCFKENKSKDNLYYIGDFRPEFLMEKGDIITPLTEQAIGLLGSTAIIPESGKYIQSQDVAKIVCKENLLDKDFAFYLISSNIVKQQLSAAAWIPKLAEQKRIGKLLRNLDRKIELNRAINQNLEAMAKQLYDYWFVQFDLPDKNGRPYKSSGGKMVWNEKMNREIPEIFEWCTLKDFIQLEDTKRIPLSSKERLDKRGGYPYYGATGIMDYVNDYIFDGDYLLLAEDGSTSDENGNPIVQYIWGKNWVNNHAHIILPQTDGFILYTYQLLKNIPAKMIETGSIQKKISQENLLAYKIILPIQGSIKYYCEIISPLWEQRKNNIEEILALTKQRDELLPLLMNGQVSVNSDLSVH